MNSARKRDLIYDAATRWAEIAKAKGLELGRGADPPAYWTFPFRSYAVKATDCGTYWGLSVWDKDANHIGNIAA